MAERVRSIASYFKKQNKKRRCLHDVGSVFSLSSVVRATVPGEHTDLHMYVLGGL